MISSWNPKGWSPQEDSHPGERADEVEMTRKELSLGDGAWCPERTSGPEWGFVLCWNHDFYEVEEAMEDVNDLDQHGR